MQLYPSRQTRWPPASDPYFLHCYALAPLVKTLPADNRVIPGEIPLTPFAAFLCRQQLHVLWHEMLQAQENPKELKDLLNVATRASVAAQLPQQRLLQEAHEVLNQAGIPWFVAKGAHLQQVYYQQAMHRPATDIDLFVHERDREVATQCLTEAGFVAKPLTETLSHELKLMKHNMAIDLHWHLLRPGRFRPGLMDWLFEHRQKFGDYWGLDATASLLVMLAHPAITKYLISPTSMLIHQVDQTCLIQSGKVDWKELQAALTRFGLKTAGWSSLYLLRQLTGLEAPQQLEQQLKPRGLHAAWLRQWIDHAWISRWFERRWLVAGLFNLALQDSVADAIIAVKLRAAGRRVPNPQLSGSRNAVGNRPKR